jgi:dihydropyrimidinase
MPGGIDAHTHLDMPFGGTTSSDDFETGTLAAAYGGTTSLVDFAIQTKGEALRAGLDTWHAKAQGKAAIDYGFHMIMTDVNDATAAEMGEVVKEGSRRSRCSWRTRASCSSTTDRSSAPCSAQERWGRSSACTPRTGSPSTFSFSRRSPKGTRHRSTTRSRAPRSPRPRGRTAPFVSPRWPARPSTWCTCRPNERCKKSSKRATEGCPTFAETCPQYLFLSDEDLARPGFEGAKFVCTPPLRPKAMQEDLWRGLRTHDLQVVSTDHCPFCMKGQKDLGKDSFAKIPNGMPGIETRLYLLWDGGVKKGRSR